MLEVFEQDIKEQLIYIFGEEWKAGIYDLELNYMSFDYAEEKDAEIYDSPLNCLRPKYAFEDGYDLALNMWLSKQGYITWESFHASGYNRPAECNRDNEQVVVRAIQTIEANMQAKHPDLRLKLVGEAYPNDPVLRVRWNFNDLKWDGEYIKVPGLKPEIDPLTVPICVIFFFMIFFYLIFQFK